MVEHEKRDSIRVAARLEFEFRAEGTQQTGYIEDLSETGAYIDTPQPLPVGTELEFEFRLHDDMKETPVTGRATVVRCEPTVGMALHFHDLEPEVVARVRFYVATVFFDQDLSGVFES